MRAASLLLALFASVLFAAQDPLKPSGPVTVTADRAEWKDGSAMLYSGNVSLSSDTLKLGGDRMELTQHPDGTYDARITGSPAKLEHAASTVNGKPAPPVSAAASVLVYTSKTGVVDLQGEARMTRGSDEINGANIQYNAAERRIQASGSAGGQVKIVIQPPKGS